MSKSEKELFAALRSRGVRKKVAKPIAALDGNRRRAGATGEKAAKRAVADLNAAADEIEKRVLRKSRNGSAAAQKAARTRKRNAAKRKASARRGSKTRANVKRTRQRAKTRSKRR